MRKINIVILLLFLTGCSHVDNYVKPDVDFSKIKKIAVVKFYPQLATDATILALIQKGFDVLEKEQLLHNEGIDAILYGSTVESREAFIRDVAQISLSLKMFDSRSGKLIWSANTAGENLDEINKAVRKLINTIP